MEETEDIDSVINGHYNDIRILVQEICEIVHRVGRSAYIKSTTVNPDDNGLFSIEHSLEESVALRGPLTIEHSSAFQTFRYRQSSLVPYSAEGSPGSWMGVLP